METLLNYVQHEATVAIQRAFPELSAADAAADVAQSEFGHYQCNSALRLSKLLKMNPRAVAQNIIDSLEKTFTSVCSQIEIAGPGFINITFTAQFLSQQLSQVFNDPKLGLPRP